MSRQIKAEIVAIGTELLRGEITDTNSSYIASELPFLGIETSRITAMGDYREQLYEWYQRALERSDIVISSGGLGPTEDDLTRESIASVVNEELYIDETLEKNLRSLFERIGRDMPPHNLKQALLVPSAQSLPNPRGTAPGWWVEKNGKVIVALPGPPRELRPMWQNEVVPRIKQKFPCEAILSRTIKTFSIPEAEIAELLQPFFDKGNPAVGIYSKIDGNHIRLIAQGDDAELLLDNTEKELEALLTPFIWGKGEDSLEGVIGALLHQRKLTVATLEDGTGGLLANIITGNPQSSGYYMGSIVSNGENLTSDCGVPSEIIEKYGAISAETAEAMATTAKERFSAHIGISTTNIIKSKSPTGGQPGLTYIGIADQHGTRSWQQNYPATREDTRNRMAVAALFRLRERLLETESASK